MKFFLCTTTLPVSAVCVVAPSSDYAWRIFDAHVAEQGLDLRKANHAEVRELSQDYPGVYPTIEERKPSVCDRRAYAVHDFERTPYYEDDSYAADHEAAVEAL